VIGTLLVDLIFTSALCISIAQLPQGQPASGRVAASLARPLRSAMTNPLPWAIALGAIAAATGLSLPRPIAEIVRMLGDSATPVALFTIGAVLWRAGLHAHTRTPVSQYLPVALIKLGLHPLLVGALGLLAGRVGLAVSPPALTVMVLAAALPSASNVSLLAERYGADNGRVARIIMTSTILAFGSVSLLAWALGPGRQ
jgi:predicted permease